MQYRIRCRNVGWELYTLNERSSYTTGAGAAIDALFRVWRPPCPISLIYNAQQCTKSNALTASLRNKPRSRFDGISRTDSAAFALSCSHSHRATYAHTRTAHSYMRTRRFISRGAADRCQLRATRLDYWLTHYNYQSDNDNAVARPPLITYGIINRLHYANKSLCYSLFDSCWQTEGQVTTYTASVYLRFRLFCTNFCLYNLYITTQTDSHHHRLWTNKQTDTKEMKWNSIIHYKNTTALQHVITYCRDPQSISHSTKKKMNCILQRNICSY